VEQVLPIHERTNGSQPQSL